MRKCFIVVFIFSISILQLFAVKSQKEWEEEEENILASKRNAENRPNIIESIQSNIPGDPQIHVEFTNSDDVTIAADSESEEEEDEDDDDEEEEQLFKRKKAKNRKSDDLHSFF